MGPLTNLYDGRTASTGTPSITLNSPSNTGTVATVTPTLDFTGVTSSGDQNISYEVQVDSVSTFNSQPQTPAFVQTTTGTNAGGTGSFSISAFTNNTVAGNSIIVALATQSQTISSVTDNALNSYSKATSLSAANLDIEVWYASGITGGNKPTITVTVSSTFTTSVVAQEFSGLLTASAFDKAASGSGNGTTATSAATTTTAQAIELIIGAVATEVATAPTLGSGFSNLGTVSDTFPTTVGIESRVVTSTGAYTSSFGTASSNWTIVVATFKAGAVPLIDALSASGGHDAAQFADITNPGDVDPFPSGDQIGFTIPGGEALTNTNTYFWRARQIVPPGNVNYVSAYSSTFSFTVSTTATRSGSTLSLLGVG